MSLFYNITKFVLYALSISSYRPDSISENLKLWSYRSLSSFYCIPCLRYVTLLMCVLNIIVVNINCAHLLKVINPRRQVSPLQRHTDVAHSVLMNWYCNVNCTVKPFMCLDTKIWRIIGRAPTFPLDGSKRVVSRLAGKLHLPSLTEVFNFLFLLLYLT